MEKKGMSPLVATVLLIAFAVALGAVVLNWGEEFVQEATAVGGEFAGACPAGCVSVDAIKTNPDKFQEIFVDVGK